MATNEITVYLDGATDQFLDIDASGVSVVEHPFEIKGSGYTEQQIKSMTNVKKYWAYVDTSNHIWVCQYSITTADPMAWIMLDVPVDLDNYVEKNDYDDDMEGVNGAIEAVTANVGDLLNLTTIDKSSVVGAINEVLDDVKQGFANNLIPYPYYRADTYTHNGITYTVNDDLSVTANGTATATSTYNFRGRTETTNTLYLAEGSYTLSGCPSGGGSSTYRLRVNETYNNAGRTVANDSGNGDTFTVDAEKAVYPKGVYVEIYTGTTVNNLVFKPMLEKGTVAHDYVPYNDSIGGVRRDIGDLAAVISDAYISSSTYKVGQLCIYNNTLYRCNTAITTAEEWTVAHWTATTIAEEIENRVLWFPGVTVSATTGNIINLSDSRITTGHVLAKCDWANDSYITALSSWSTETDGTLTISGTCSTATTADVMLVKKNN